METRLDTRQLLLIINGNRAVLNRAGCDLTHPRILPDQVPQPVIEALHGADVADDPQFRLVIARVFLDRQVEVRQVHRRKRPAYDREPQRILAEKVAQLIGKLTLSKGYRRVLDAGLTEVAQLIGNLM